MASNNKSELKTEFTFFTTYFQKLSIKEFEDLTREFLRKKGVTDVNDFKVKLFTGKIAHRIVNKTVRTVFIDILQVDQEGGE